ncbi:ribosomal protein S18-alanine N-acetyltransferase [Clostridium sardiniense]|uniref:[Ribosomal protein bS18]-alanine N-acetyltransferase n=1 Tax=Clostridium sardiniense TaxID=29369 RepID=A0ABS7KYZ0_CLOSR|nr:ribosomal protein S18-alanine N-acetyltransferase [Clostridium sardiniense]MBM7835801.1 ribosomal-protein-alanine N-acetyltransferase [Clostridium sardiniense]MBY0755797.1 ribosomal protein S18-alanine N-acetyltransferase [Clostridium sardiniense]MDQ0459975.1 ribosomal-protein-alanine N-acetyltransferase [Clostridium sardiniense]
MANLILKNLDSEDLNGVYEVSSLSLKESWSLDSITKEISNKFARYIVCKEENKVVGFAGAWLIASEGQITNVAVHPEYRGKGIGKKLMKSLISSLKQEDCNSITLEVRESNTVAKNLYKSFGFISEGIRKNFYEDNKEDANIMWLRNI